MGSLSEIKAQIDKAVEQMPKEALEEAANKAKETLSEVATTESGMKHAGHTGKSHKKDSSAW